MNDPVTEYAVRVTYRPAQTGRVREFGPHLADARAAYYHEVSLHGEDAVEFMFRQVRRTPWAPGKLPPPVDRETEMIASTVIPVPAAPVCGETLYERPIDDITTGGML
jgi:hypothetical protein